MTSHSTIRNVPLYDQRIRSLDQIIRHSVYSAGYFMSSLSLYSAEYSGSLEKAAKSDDTEMISTILSSLSPHQRLEVLSVGGGMNMTPLHWAAYKGNTDSVKMILSHLTSEQQLTLLSMGDRHGRTPADWASMGGNKETERLLRDYGQRANQQTEQQRIMSAIFFHSRPDSDHLEGIFSQDFISPVGLLNGNCDGRRSVRTGLESKLHYDPMRRDHRFNKIYGRDDVADRPAPKQLFNLLSERSPTEVVLSLIVGHSAILMKEESKSEKYFYQMVHEVQRIVKSLIVSKDPSQQQCNVDNHGHAICKRHSHPNPNHSMCTQDQLESAIRLYLHFIKSHDDGVILDMAKKVFHVCHSQVPAEPHVGSRFIVSANTVWTEKEKFLWIRKLTRRHASGVRALGQLAYSNYIRCTRNLSLPDRPVLVSQMYTTVARVHAESTPMCGDDPGEFRPLSMLSDTLSNEAGSVYTVPRYPDNRNPPLSVLKQPDMTPNRDGSLETDSSALGISTNRAAMVEYAPDASRLKTYNRWPDSSPLAAADLCAAVSESADEDVHYNTSLQQPHDDLEEDCGGSKEFSISGYKYAPYREAMYDITSVRHLSPSQPELQVYPVQNDESGEPQGAAAADVTVSNGGDTEREEAGGAGGGDVLQQTSHSADTHQASGGTRPKVSQQVQGAAAVATIDQREQQLSPPDNQQEQTLQGISQEDLRQILLEYVGWNNRSSPTGTMNNYFGTVHIHVSDQYGAEGDGQSARNQGRNHVIDDSRIREYTDTLREVQDAQKRHGDQLKNQSEVQKRHGDQLNEQAERQDQLDHEQKRMCDKLEDEKRNNDMVTEFIASDVAESADNIDELQRGLNDVNRQRLAANGGDDLPYPVQATDGDGQPAADNEE